MNRHLLDDLLGRGRRNPYWSPEPRKSYFEKSGSIGSQTSPLPDGFSVVFSNAKYSPLFDGASYRVTVDFGNGTAVFYPGGCCEVVNADCLGIRIYYKEKLVLERKI